MQSEDEYAQFSKQLEAARQKPGNKIGNGGQLIALKSPKEFADTMKILVLHDTKTDEKDLKNENFNTIDPTQAQTAAMAMGMTLQTGLGATIVDDGQKGRESIIQNLASDEAKLASQIASGYAIRNGLVQKMAPGDQMFHVVSYEGKTNKFTSYKTRELANEAYSKMSDNIPRIIMSGETGDMLQSHGPQNWRDQCLGMFLTQRYSGKYYGRS